MSGDLRILRMHCISRQFPNGGFALSAVVSSALLFGLFWRILSILSSLWCFFMKRSGKKAVRERKIYFFAFFMACARDGPHFYRNSDETVYKMGSFICLSLRTLVLCLVHRQGMTKLMKNSSIDLAHALQVYRHLYAVEWLASFSFVSVPYNFEKGGAGKVLRRVYVTCSLKKHFNFKTVLVVAQYREDVHLPQTRAPSDLDGFSCFYIDVKIKADWDHGLLEEAKGSQDHIILKTKFTVIGEACRRAGVFATLFMIYLVYFALEGVSASGTGGNIFKHTRRCMSHISELQVVYDRLESQSGSVSSECIICLLLARVQKNLFILKQC